MGVTGCTGAWGVLLVYENKGLGVWMPLFEINGCGGMGIEGGVSWESEGAWGLGDELLLVED